MQWTNGKVILLRGKMAILAIKMAMLVMVMVLVILELMVQDKGVVMVRKLGIMGQGHLKREAPSGQLMHNDIVHNDFM